MPPLISEEEIDAISSDNEFDDEPIYTEMLEDMFYDSQSHLSINRRKACYKICDCILKIQSEWKGALLST